MGGVPLLPTLLLDAKCLSSGSKERRLDLHGADRMTASWWAIDTRAQLAHGGETYWTAPEAEQNAPPDG